jgi:hypothetical protein
MDATVSPVSEHGFLVIGTGSSLAAATGGSAALRLRTTAAQTLGVGLDIGIGTGRTEREAEEAARKRLGSGTSAGVPHQLRVDPQVLQAAVAGPDTVVATAQPADPPGQRPRSAGTSSSAAVPSGLVSAVPGPGGPAQGALGPGGLVSAVPGPGGSVPAAAQVRRAVGRPPAARTGTQPDSLSRLRSLETLTRLARKLAADAAPVVDAELTGQLLSVTPRTARRQLRAMADQGLALPLPPRRTPHPGRPRQAYRLVVEELGREAVP